MTRAGFGRSSSAPARATARTGAGCAATAPRCTARRGPIKRRGPAVPALVLILAAAAALRLGHARAVYGVFTPYDDPQEEYYESGVALGETGLFSPYAEGLEAKAWRGPLFPAFIAAAEAPFRKPWPGHVVVVQALLSTAAVGVAAALAWLLGGAPAAVGAAVFIAFDPAQTLAVSSLNIHGFYGLAVLALAAAAALCARGLLSPAALGLSLAGTLLCRTAHFLAVPLLGLWAARRRGLRAAAALALWTALGLLPFVVRNAARIGGLVPLDAGGGSYGLLAASQGRTGATGVADGLALAESLRPGFRARHPDPVDAETAARALALEEIAKRPGRFAASGVVRLWLFCRPLLPLLLLAAFAFLGRPRDPALEAVGCVALSFSAYALVGWQPGYELGVAPVIDVLAGCGAAALWARARAARKPAAEPAASGRAARAVLRAWTFGLLLLTAGVMAWSLADAARGRGAPPAYAGPRVLSLLRDGSVRSGGRWMKSRPLEELRAIPLRNEGVRLFLDGRFEEALEPLRGAVAAFPRSAEDRLNLCVALGRLDRVAEAIEQCDRAVALARSQPDLLASARSSRASLRKKGR